ncbi:hypothetical protein KAS08_02980 [Candidatus Pacearchaeota archaeon]|nr:hypothetical protein [Candidatus Pacearchaeota archaeon]
MKPEYLKIIYKEDPKKVTFKKKLEALSAYYNINKKELEKDICNSAKDEGIDKDMSALLLILRVRAEAITQIEETAEELNFSNKSITKRILNWIKGNH